MNEIVGWFPDENAELLDMLIREYDIKTIIEIGCFVGKSTVFFAERVEKVYTIDPFTAHELWYTKAGKEIREASLKQHQYFYNNTRKYDNIELYEGLSEDVFMSYPDLHADLVYIDGSHTYEDVKKDIKMWDSRADKVLCGDDYTWDGVKKAVNESPIKFNTNQRVWYHVKEDRR